MEGEAASGRRKPKEDEMSQGAFVTLVGYVAQEPNIRTTKTGKTVTDLRVGITPRYRDHDRGVARRGVLVLHRQLLGPACASCPRQHAQG